MIVTDVASGFEFIFVQSTPSAIWVIEHNMNCHPVATVIDSGNSQVEGDVTYDTLNQITIRFTAGFSGRAILR
jgi:hypothetical protein